MKLSENNGDNQVFGVWIEFVCLLVGSVFVLSVCEMNEWMCLFVLWFFACLPIWQALLWQLVKVTYSICQFEIEC